LPVARRELIGRGPDARAVALDLDRLIGGERALLRLGGEEREVPSLTRRASCIVPRHVCRHDEEPPPRVLRFVHQRSGECLLSEVFGALGVPHLAVQEPHERAVSIAVDLREILGRRAPHSRHCLKSLTSVASSPDAHSVLPPAAILMLVRRPATRTAGSSVAGCTSSGSARSSAKYTSLNGATVITRSESPCAMSVQVLSRHTKTLPPTRRERSARSPGPAASESARPPVTPSASRLSEPASFRASRERSTASAPA